METMPENKHLNLARKWRPQSFDQIVGQTITTRILKNSLFLKKYFPVYLFAGQRGCGKTTTARIFASAINCYGLTQFQAQPAQTAIPCLACKSCLAMANGHHPDFIEIDAASHTGVDNVRHIIEASSYVPLLGQKKIYLIDEAHMLSKAAFNAFLKLLEEPSENVLFILATTELNKIPQTVLSRCFQLSFSALDHTLLKEHMISICSQEGIICGDDDVLDAIIEETDGSARDALNLLEQVRFSTDKITTNALFKVLGKISNTTIIALFEQILTKNPTALLRILQKAFQETVIPQQVWNSFVDLCQALLWLKYGIETIPNSFHKNFDDLCILASNCSLNQLHAIMQLLWQQEPLFLQTNKKQIFLETTLLQLCQQTTITDIEELTQALQNTMQESSSSETMKWQSDTPAKKHFEAPTTQPMPQERANPEEERKQTITLPSTQSETPWGLFIEQLKSTNKDLWLNSILLQAQFLGFNEATGIITLGLSSNGKFFKDKLQESKALLIPLLNTFFPQCSGFEFDETIITKPPFNASQEASLSSTLPQQQPINQPEKRITPRGTETSSYQKREKTTQFETLDVSDKQKWPFANLILNYFPGKIKKANVSN